MKLTKILLTAWLCLATIVWTGAWACVSARVVDENSEYCLQWDSPSENAHGTMPLGNGEVGGNVWVDPAGDVNFFLSRTDCFDEYGRLVKVGGGKIVLPKDEEEDEDNEEENTFPGITSKLDVRDGVLHIHSGYHRARMWVDAHRPVVVVEVENGMLLEDDSPDNSPKFQMQLWRTEPGEEVVAKEASNLLNPWKAKMRTRPDVILSADQAGENAVGWYHHNAETFGYDENAKIQGMEDFPRENPLLHRTFGALVKAYSETCYVISMPENSATESAFDGTFGFDAVQKLHKNVELETRVTPAVRVDEKTLRCKSSRAYIFEIAVHTSHPATPDEWLREAKKILAEAEETPLQDRYENHVAWWNDFWQRSWIHLTPADVRVINAGEEPVKLAPEFYTAHPRPLRVGVDSAGGSRFTGSILYFKAWQLAEGKKGLQKRETLAAYENVPAEIPGSDAWTFPHDGEFFLRIKTPEKFTGHQRLLDKITAGGSDGFMLDIAPDGKLRLILGKDTLLSAEALKPGEDYTVWFTFNAAGVVTVKLDDEEVISQGYTALEETELLTRTYILQRYIDACASRGNFPVIFNGSIFAVPHETGTNHADYRRWGTGYWWQNCRLPYYSKFMAGDYDMLAPFFDMYGGLLPICEYRTEKYFGFKNAAYYPECIYSWGDVFAESYGLTPWNEREDKLQQSGWHKWEWVSGLELACMMLNYYDHTGDEAFLKEKAIPLADSVTRFFDAYYKTDETTGKLIMTPSQAVETWWECTNPAPEVAGLHATLGRLLALPENLTTEAQREAWQTLLRKIPDIPVWTDNNGVKRLAPAEKFAKKRNVENPELYPVFPFRQVSFEKPLREEAVNALNLRWDRGPHGWRQDDLFMAYLGLTDQASDYLIQRARQKNAQSRFPAFWGPNYDWTPDQCHGGVLTAGIQSLIMQTDGRKIFLFPALPARWNADFKLHAPFNTTVEGKVENGVVTSLIVTPEERRKDVILCEPFTFQVP